MTTTTTFRLSIALGLALACAPAFAQRALVGSHAGEYRWGAGRSGSPYFAGVRSDWTAAPVAGGGASLRAVSGARLEFLGNRLDLVEATADASTDRSSVLARVTVLGQVVPNPVAGGNAHRRRFAIDLRRQVRFDYGFEIFGVNGTLGVAASLDLEVRRRASGISDDDRVTNVARTRAFARLVAEGGMVRVFDETAFGLRLTVDGTALNSSLGGDLGWNAAGDLAGKAGLRVVPFRIRAKIDWWLVFAHDQRQLFDWSVPGLERPFFEYAPANRLVMAAATRAFSTPLVYRVTEE